MNDSHAQENEEIEVRAPRGARFVDAKKLNLREEVINLNRVAKVVKGGRRFSFAALVAVGDGNGHVGLGYGKANEVPDAIQKAAQRARKSVVRIPLQGRTIPHAVVGIHDSARVLLRPASEGTGLIAGASVRTYLDLAGVHDILAKSLGSGNVINVIRAVEKGLLDLKKADEIARLRGKKIESLIGLRRSRTYLETQGSILQSTDPDLARAMKDAAAAVGTAPAPAPVPAATAQLQDNLPDGGQEG